jgi:hypothetical protein
MKAIIQFSWLWLCISGWGQTTDKIVFNEGVKSYREGNYAAAQERFEAVAGQNPQNTRALFNAGNSAFLGGDYEKAKQYFSQYAVTSSSAYDRAKGFYNLGNVQLQEALQAETNPQTQSQVQNHLKQAIASYKESLKHNPTDEDAKYNLTYAMKKLQQNQQNEQNQPDNKDQKNDNNKEDKDQQGEQDKGEQDKQNDPSDQKGDDQKEDKKGEDDKSDAGNDNKKETQKPGQMTREQALKDLDAVNNDERKVLQKVTGTKATKSQDAKLIKDW